jgi:hypothetical protein
MQTPSNIDDDADDEIRLRNLRFHRHCANTDSRMLATALSKYSRV